jgi:hypothetical protein
MSVAVALAVEQPGKPASGIINLDLLADLLASSAVTEKIELGTAAVIRANHPIFGAMILVNTVGARNALIYE